MIPWEVRQGDVLARLKEMPDESIQCVVTSPPFWGLRDYQTATWEGGDPACEHRVRENARTESSTLGGGKKTTGHQREGFKDACPRCGARRVDQQIGLEPSPYEYVDRMTAVFAEVRRVLRRDGTLWLNMGDCYATGAGKVGEHPGGGERGAKWAGRGGRPRGTRPTGQGGLMDDGRRKALPIGPMTQANRMPIEGLKPKDLVGMPWRIAFALQADGWWLRSNIIWAKTSPMPESVRDRPTNAHEFVFLMTRAQKYYYDADAIAEPCTGLSGPPVTGWATGPGSHEARDHNTGSMAERKTRSRRGKAITSPRHDGNAWNENNGRGFIPKGATRNRRSVWEIATTPFKGAHFATFPEKLVEPCIRAGTKQGDLVLDPFAGSGTTGVVARKLDRRFVGIELNPTYCEMARRRIGDVAPLLDATSRPA